MIKGHKYTHGFHISRCFLHFLPIPKMNSLRFIFDTISSTSHVRIKNRMESSCSGIFLACLVFKRHEAKKKILPLPPFPFLHIHAEEEEQLLPLKLFFLFSGLFLPPLPFITNGPRLLSFSSSSSSSLHTTLKVNAFARSRRVHCPLLLLLLLPLQVRRRRRRAAAVRSSIDKNLLVAFAAAVGGGDSPLCAIKPLFLSSAFFLRKSLRQACGRAVWRVSPSLPPP